MHAEIWWGNVRDGVRLGRQRVWWNKTHLHHGNVFACCSPAVKLFFCNILLNSVGLKQLFEPALWFEGFPCDQGQLHAGWYAEKEQEGYLVV